MIFVFNDTATTEIYTLALHAALPISAGNLTEYGIIAATSPEAVTNPSQPFDNISKILVATGNTAAGGFIFCNQSLNLSNWYGDEIHTGFYYALSNGTRNYIEKRFSIGQDLNQIGKGIKGGFLQLFEAWNLKMLGQLLAVLVIMGVITSYAAEFVGGSYKIRDRNSTRLNSSHIPLSRMPSSA